MEIIYGGLKNVVKGDIVNMDRDNFTIEVMRGKTFDTLDLEDLFEKAKRQLATFNEGDEISVNFVMEKINK